MARGPARPGLVAVSIQRIVRGETVRYRARVKSHGREVATRVFTRKSDAVAWEHDQRRSQQRSMYPAYGHALARPSGISVSPITAPTASA